jgi:hypothetical protein
MFDRISDPKAIHNFQLWYSINNSHCGCHKRRTFSTWEVLITDVWETLNNPHISLLSAKNSSWIFRSLLNTIRKCPVWTALLKYFLYNRHACLCIYNFWEELTAYYTSRPHRKRSAQQFFCCCVCISCRSKVFTELLPSNDRRIHIHTQRLMGGIYEVRRSDGFRCRDINTKFHEDWFRHSKADGGGDTQAHNTQTAWFIRAGALLRAAIVMDSRPDRSQQSAQWTWSGPLTEVRSEWCVRCHLPSRLYRQCKCNHCHATYFLTSAGHPVTRSKSTACIYGAKVALTLCPYF